MNVRAKEILSNEHFVQPLRVVIDSQQQLSPDAKIFQNEGRCWLVSTDKLDRTFPSNVDLVQVDADEGRVKLESLLAKLAEHGINDVLIEAGSELLGAFLQQGLVDELQVFMAPKLLGHAARPMAHLPFDSMSQAINLELQDVRQVGQDLKLTYRVE
jgi:diaminohydroxyphosphoribosylaminopyrimidine deaminase/5-amino-6-(5-phosphoribosylamino)uracil reductase